MELLNTIFILKPFKILYRIDQEERKFYYFKKLPTVTSNVNFLFQSTQNLVI